MPDHQDAARDWLQSEARTSKEILKHGLEALAECDAEAQDFNRCIEQPFYEEDEQQPPEGGTT